MLTTVSSILERAEIAKLDNLTAVVTNFEYCTFVPIISLSISA